MADHSSEPAHFNGNGGSDHVGSDDTTQVHGGAGHSDESPLDTASSIDDHIAEKVPQEQGPQSHELIVAHFQRFWWIYILLLVILLAVLLPILFLVIIPAIVQAIVTGQTVPVNGGALYAINPNQVLMSINTSLNTPIPAHLAALKLNLYNTFATSFSPFANIAFEATPITKDTTLQFTNKTIDVLDHNQLVAWFNQYFDEATADLGINADPSVSVYLDSLHSNANLNKTIQIAGLNYLKGINTEELELMLPADKDGNNIKGTILLPNSGALVLGLGNLTFDLYAGDVNLGFINIYDLVLQKGNNTPSFIGKLYFNRLVPNLGKILRAEIDALGEGNIQLNATGSAATNNGVDIAYLREVLESKKLTLNIPLLSLIGDVLVALVGGGDAKGSLLDIVTEVFGNSTLIQNALDNFTQSPSGQADLSNLTSTASASASSARPSATGAAARKRSKAMNKLALEVLRMKIRDY